MLGVTIAALTGSDSAPAKANEAKQKNDIGSAKDEVSMFVQNELTDAYEDVYVNGAARGASTRIGTAVITAVNGKYGTALPHGNAHIQSKTNSTTGNGEITIWTTDFKIIGTIDKNGGILSWGELTANDGTTPVSQTSTKTLISIAITTEPTKTSYNVGEALNLAGIVVTATYSDNTTSEVTDKATYSPSDGATLNTAEETEITATYIEGDVTKTATTSVTVSVAEDTGGDPTAANSVQSLAKAKTLQVGDFVKYNPGTSTSASLNLPEGTSINSEESISASAYTPMDDWPYWRILDINQTTGEVLITIDGYVDQPQLELYSFNGYNNSIIAIEMIAEIYKNDLYAKSARSITKVDIDKLDNHTPNVNVKTETWNHRYGVNNTTLDITDAGAGNSISQSYSSTIEDSYYSNFLQSGYFWIASRGIAVDDENKTCSFCIWNLADGNVDKQSLFDVNSDGTISENSISFSVLPVITLKSGIKMTSDEQLYERNVWQLSRGDE